MNRLPLNIQMFADGKVVIDVQLDEKQFTNGLNNLQNKTKSAGSTIKSIVAGLGITKLISGAFNMISSSAGDAIKRLDTLNNFPKVMDSLGISAEASSKSISKMSEKLAGLPTTLDQGASAVKRFTAYNGDVEKSTDMFLAVNNAILAGGASMELQSSALEQLTQAYTKGKPEAQDWKTIMQAMPAQLKQIANTMGYTSTAIGGDFYNALIKGDITMDDFMNTAIELNEKGGKSFQSFSEQAKVGTTGIQTSITVAKTQVVKGVTDILDALNVSLENTAFGSLGGLIAQAGEKAKVALDMVANLISGKISAFDFGKNVGELVTKTLKQLTDKLPKFLDTGIKMLVEMGKGFVSQIPEMIKNAIKLLESINNTIIDNLDEILELGLDIILALVDGIADNIDKIIDVALKIVIALVNKLTEPKTLEKLAQAAGKILVALVVALIKAVPKLAEATGQIQNKIKSELEKLPSKMLTIGINIVKGIWSGIKQRGSQLKEDVKDWAQGIVNSIKKKLGIHSPSKVFKDQVGKMMAEGIGVGFKEGIDDVYKDMQNAIDLETDKMSANVQSSGTYQVAMNGTPTFNLKDNSTNQTQLVVDGRVLAEIVNTENRNREVAKA